MRSALKRNKYQIICILFIFVFNFSYYIPVLFTFKIYHIPGDITFCYNLEYNFITYMDLGYLLVAFLVLLIFSCFLIYFLISSHARVFSNYASSQNEYFKKDVRLSITSILFNLLYVLLFLSVNIISNFFPNTYDLISTAALYVSFLNYSSNFYIMIASNSKFRKEFKNLFEKNQQQQQPQQPQQPPELQSSQQPQ